MKLPQTIVYAWKCEGNTTVSFKINDSKLLEKYNQIWKKVEKLLRIEFASKLVYGDNAKYMVAVWIQIFKAKKCQKKKYLASLYQ